MPFKKNIYRFFLATCYYWRHSVFLNKIWERIIHPEFDVKISLHKLPATIPSTYIYPLITRSVPAFNNPLLELVCQVNKYRQKKLYIADIGAAIGDTFLFLYANIPDAIDKVLCAEGDADFVRYLIKNTNSYKECIPVHIMLSDKTGNINSLYRIHDSTNSAQGNEEIAAVPFDKVWEEYIKQPPDIIKIDTDGFDGKILAGTKKILLQYQPAIIFEYHPILIQDTKNSLELAFIILKECNYKTLLWFNKWGNYSHTTIAEEMDKNLLYAKKCIEGGTKEDMHYDIIALPVGSPIDIHELMQCTFAKNKKAPY